MYRKVSGLIRTGVRSEGAGEVSDEDWGKGLMGTDVGIDKDRCKN